MESETRVVQKVEWSIVQSPLLPLTLVPLPAAQQGDDLVTLRQTFVRRCQGIATIRNYCRHRATDGGNLPVSFGSVRPEEHRTHCAFAIFSGPYISWYSCRPGFARHAEAKIVELQAWIEMENLPCRS